MEAKIRVDDQLMQSALQLSGLQTENAVIEKALQTFVQLLRQQNIRKLRGKLKWEGDLNQMRLDKL